jgi:hypothetical protein
MSAAKDGGDGRRLSARLGRARQAGVRARRLAADIKTLTVLRIAATMIGVHRSHPFDATPSDAN